MTKKKFTLDNSTIASNPGKITFKPWVWARHDPLHASFWLGGLLICLVFVLKGVFAFIIPFLYFTYRNFYYWMGAKEHFSADSNGGLVISTQPPLVAVSTNLTYSNHYYPAIKVIPYKTNKPIAIGDKIATVAIYSQTNPNNHLYWDDFFPLPVDYATNNRQEIQQALASYEPDYWQSLERQISELEKPYKPGLYHVEKNNSDW